MQQQKSAQPAVRAHTSGAKMLNVIGQSQPVTQGLTWQALLWSSLRMFFTIGLVA